MTCWKWNGEAYEAADALPLSDRGFRYGMALFESMRVWDGAVEFWAAHQQRLLTACAERDFPASEQAVAAAEDVFANAGFSGFARIYATAGDGGPSSPVKEPRIFLMLEARELERESSWALAIHEDTVLPLFRGLKTANYWFNCDALTQAHAKGANETLLFNDHAELVSACCANVFVVRGNEIATPSRASGCRNGVIREWVLKRRKSSERRLRREDVVEADEIFLTNSWLGVMPISTLEGRPLGPKSVGPKLAAELRSV